MPILARRTRSPRPAIARVLTMALVLPGLPLAAQGSRDSSRTVDDTLRAQALGAVRVTVTRETARSPLELPFAATRLFPDATRPALRRTGIGDLLLAVPGVVVQDRANPSQDPRLAIRGFGARSAFGVRGVRVLRDGIPVSLPDGQAPLDWIDLETVGAVDAVRGTAAALYGNAAGGVIDFRSRDPDPVPFALRTRGWDGGGLRRLGAQVSGSVPSGAAPGGGGWLASLTSTRGDGPRRYSRLEATSAFARGFATLAGTRLELQGTVYDTPRADNTGALTATELARDPALPDSLNVARRSRKAVEHSQLALLASRESADGDLLATLFTSRRSLENPLPFAVVGVERTVHGGSLRASRRITSLGGSPVWPLRLSAGGDVQRQADDRGNWENCNDVAPGTAPSTRCPDAGAERGALRLDQRETIVGTGVFARLEVEAPGRVFASAALRQDVVRFEVADRFVRTGNADDSGDRTLRAWSPMLGIVWRATPLVSVYANSATAFETPTITELTNQADGAAGLNRTLAPQRTATLEAGVQAILFGRMRADLALFDARVRDELVSFDVPNQPGRRAFRNAGRTRRRGVEAGVQGSAGIATFGTAYTLSRFRFEQYEVGASSYAGKPIPGIPEQALQSFATLARGGGFLTIDLNAASAVSADDGALVRAAGFAAWGARAGYTARTRGGYTIEPMLGVENLFDRRFASSVVVNATRGRYYEPGLPRRVVGGVRIATR